MKIIVDADACPVVEIVLCTAKQNGLRCILVCDTAHVFKTDEAEIITVSQGRDSADFRLVNLIERGDIVVTQDYGLAAMCLSRGADAINQNGLIYHENNINFLLEQRHIYKKMRAAGIHTKGPKKRTVQQDKEFERSLQALIQKKNTPGS